MAEIDDMLARAAEAGAGAFREELSASGHTRSGAAAASVRAEGNTVAGHAAAASLLSGRGPSAKYPPSGYEPGGETPTPLMTWCMEIFGQTAQEARGTSFLVARRIREHGDRIYRGLEPPLSAEGTVEAARQALAEQVKKTYHETLHKHDL